MNAPLTEVWPYLLLVLVGYLQNEMWRVLGLVLARGLNEDSEIVVWSCAVATAILAGVIAKLILFPACALEASRLRSGWPRRCVASWSISPRGGRSLPAPWPGRRPCSQARSCSRTSRRLPPQASWPAQPERPAFPSRSPAASSARPICAG